MFEHYDCQYINIITSLIRRAYMSHMLFIDGKHFMRRKNFISDAEKFILYYFRENMKVNKISKIFLIMREYALKNLMRK